MAENHHFKFVTPATPSAMSTKTAEPVSSGIVVSNSSDYSSGYASPGPLRGPLIFLILIILLPLAAITTGLLVWRRIRVRRRAHVDGRSDLVSDRPKQDQGGKGSGNSEVYHMSTTDKLASDTDVSLEKEERHGMTMTGAT
jgi:hypothetical protein